MERMLHQKNLVRFLILVFWGALLLFFFFTDRINLYLNKQYAPLALIAGGFFLITALFLIKRLKVEYREGEDFAIFPHEVTFRDTVVFAFFLLPLLLAVMVDPGALNSFAAGKRGVSFDYSLKKTDLLEELAKAAETEGKYEKRNLLFISSLIQNSPGKAEDRGISAIGFVHKDSSMRENQFALVRFLITCCAADAQPLGVLVETESKEELSNNQWVRVRGFLRRVEEGKESSFVLLADEVLPIEPPADPYLY